MTRTFLKADCLLTPDGPIDHAGLLIVGDRIEAVGTACPGVDRRIDLGPVVLAPGFIDIQVNGGGGVLFNEDPTPETLATIGAAHKRSGTTGFLGTLISDNPEKTARALAAVRQARRDAVPGLLGVHLEGPNLSAEKKGIHNDAHFRVLEETVIDALADPSLGSRMVTLAPEKAAPGLIETLTAIGVRVAAGHTAMTYEETRDAIDEGVTGFTHLFNAMPQMLSRAPGPIAAALESEAWCTLIADGHHVHEAMLRLAIRAKRDGRMILVTDAMSSAGTDGDSFVFGDKTILVEEGRCVDEAGTLAGSHLTMIEAVRFAVHRLGAPLHEAVNMASRNPAQYLGIDHEHGALKPGARADFLVLTKELDVAHSIIGGNLTELHTAEAL